MDSLERAFINEFKMSLQLLSIFLSKTILVWYFINL